MNRATSIRTNWSLPSETGNVMGEDSLLERVIAAAEERQLSQNSFIAYRRIWLKIIAWLSAAKCLVLETFQQKG